MGGITCKTCRHEAREAIDQALVAGESNRRIATQYALSEASVRRHKQNHLSATLVKAAESRELAHGGRLLDRVNGIVDKALASADRSEAKGDERGVQGGLREARHGLELTGRISGELQDNNRNGAPETALDAIIELASALSEGQLRAIAAGEKTQGVTIEGRGHVVEPE